MSHIKEKGLPYYYKPGSPHAGNSYLSITRSRSGFFFNPPKKGKPGQRLLRLGLLLGISVLLLLTVYMQLHFLGGDGLQDQIDPMDRSFHSDTKPTTAPAAAAAGVADAPAAAPAGGYPAPSLQHLVLVAGHAVYTGVDYALATKESSWFLESYQQVPGQAQSFLDHIRLGIETAAQDPAALLLFSGGQTRQAAGPRSEGLSYWMVAEAAGWFGHTEVRSRAFTEEHARDSFENVLFSLCRFFGLTGHYPAKITAVSYTLKQQRFELLHRAAVKFPAASFHFIGTPVPPEAKGAAAGEAATVAGFQKDPYGCSGSLLAKKSRRDPFAVGPPHPSRCPAMAELLKFCSHKQFPGPVPWDAGGAAAAAATAAGADDKSGLLPAGRRSSRSGIYT